MNSLIAIINNDVAGCITAGVQKDLYGKAIGHTLTSSPRFSGEVPNMGTSVAVDRIRVGQRPTRSEDMPQNIIGSVHTIAIHNIFYIWQDVVTITHSSTPNMAINACRYLMDLKLVREVIVERLEP